MSFCLLGNIGISNIEVHILEKLGSIDCLDAFSLLTKYISDICEKMHLVHFDLILFGHLCNKTLTN